MRRARRRRRNVACYHITTKMKREKRKDVDLLFWLGHIERKSTIHHKQKEDCFSETQNKYLTIRERERGSQARKAEEEANVILYMNESMSKKKEKWLLKILQRTSSLFFYMSKQIRFPLRLPPFWLRPPLTDDRLPLVPLPPFLFFRPFRSLRVRSFWTREQKSPWKNSMWSIFTYFLISRTRV